MVMYPSWICQRRMNLRRGLSMSIGDLNDGFIGEMLLGMPSAAKGIPGFHHDPVLLYILLRRFVLIIQMVFVLDNGRHDLGKGQDFLHGLRGVIVGDANGANFPVPNRLLQGPIHRFVVPTGLMDQHQIYVIQPQIPKRMIDTMCCAE